MTAFVAVPVILVVGALGLLRIAAAVDSVRKHSMEAWELSQIVLLGVAYIALAVGLATAYLTDLDRWALRVAVVGCAAAGLGGALITVVHHWRRIVSSPRDIGNPDAWRDDASASPK